MEGYLTASVLMLGIFTRVRGPTGGVPFAGCWSVTTRAFDVCCCARNLIALCSAASISASSAFLIRADYIYTYKDQHQRTILIRADYIPNSLTAPKLLQIYFTLRRVPVARGTLAFQPLYPPRQHLFHSMRDTLQHVAVSLHQCNSHI